MSHVSQRNSFKKLIKQVYIILISVLTISFKCGKNEIKGVTIIRKLPHLLCLRGQTVQVTLQPNQKIRYPFEKPTNPKESYHRQSSCR